MWCVNIIVIAGMRMRGREAMVKEMKKMKQTELDIKLVLACDKPIPDLGEIKELIIAGADTNQLNEYDENIFHDVFLDALYNNCEDKNKTPIIVDQIKELIILMIAKGWDIKKFGLDVMDQFEFSTYDPFTFDLYRFMLQFDLTDDVKEYEKALEAVACEEAYQRCCMHNHELENLFYAIYEMIETKMKGQDYKSIEPYYDVVGMTIDEIIYFNDEVTLVEKQGVTEYNADIGFVCGNKLFVMCESVNILFMNNRIKEQPQVDISNTFGKEIIGQKIQSISFEHKDLIKGTISYGQQIIILNLTNGKKIKFTHNFGELPDRNYQSRFWIE